MPIDPVKIPQNVYVEDRIIGPITLKQIMITLASAGFSYALWAGMRSAGGGTISAVATGIAWMPTIIGIVFAFVKINGISLFRIMLLLLERIGKPARRVWMPRQGIYVNFVIKTSSKKKAPEQEAKEESHENTHLEELSKVLDQGPPEDDEDSNITPTQAKPVNPKRIQADKRKKPVDDIRSTENDTPKHSNPGGLLRDITPPPSHA